jgi:predicted CXXCH cytochrome family protein
MTSFCFLLSAFCFTGLAKNGAYKSTKHGDTISGPQRHSRFPRGSCMQCHDGLHGSHNGQGSYDDALFAPDDNDLCFTCHAAPSAASIYPGSAFWSQTIHARSQDVYLPGADGRPSSDANKCVNCHNPHGVRDADGLIPSMLIRRDTELCVLCHNGSRATDIFREFTKPYRHPAGTRGKHDAHENSPASFATGPVNKRHAECPDCHNPHSIDANPAPPLPPLASNRLAGVSRVQAANGGAGLAPRYVWRGAEDPGANEYEICFKCHSSFTQQPPGQSNLALLTNPANASYHPIQAAGRNLRINPGAFVSGYDAQSIISCTDCHSSDTPNIRGPHGSSYRYLLKKPSTSTSDPQAMLPNDICFDCHSYDTYANPSAAGAIQQYSRFNSAGHGHSFHVGARQIPCFACHDSHGSTRSPALIVTRPGVLHTYTQTATGGSCNSACHANQTYTASYAR